MGYISNFIVQSPFLFLGLLLILSTIFFIYSMYLLLKMPKKDQIQNAIKHKKMVELKAHDEYKAKFKSIHKVR